MPEIKPRPGGVLHLVSTIFRRLGLFVIALGVLRYGVAALQANMPHETVATVESAYAGRNTCVAQEFTVFKILNAPRLKGMSDEEIEAAYERQCEGANSVGGNITLVLTWTDHNMGEHKTYALVSPATGEKLIQRGRLQRDAARIRYTSTAKDAAVVLMEEIESSQREAARIMMAGAVVTLLGTMGGALLSWRRKAATP